MKFRNTIYRYSNNVYFETLNGKKGFSRFVVIVQKENFQNSLKNWLVLQLKFCALLIDLHAPYTPFMIDTSL